MQSTRFLSGLADIAHAYDGFIVDQWGVLHDGTRPAVGAIQALARMRAHAPVVLLSNSSRRIANNRAQLAEIGYGADAYDAVVTSGEATWHALTARAEPPFDGLGRRCRLFAFAGDRGLLEGLDVEAVADAGEADFLLVSGVDAFTTIEPFVPELERALGRGLPLICANPDVLVRTASGLHMAAGAIAKHYAALGGQVTYIGKPHSPVYRLCLEHLEPLGVKRILAVGDSLEHDVAGGAGMGLDTAFIMNGIHADAFDHSGHEGHTRALDGLVAEHGTRPTYALPSFRWS